MTNEEYLEILDNNVSLTFVKDIKYGKSRTDISKNYNIGLSK